MPAETVLDRLLRLVDEAVRSGRFTSRTDFWKQAGMSSGFVGEFRKRMRANPEATMTLETAHRCAELLEVPVEAFSGTPTEALPVVDKYEGRAFAISAARDLQYPEAAIQSVLREDPGEDPGRMYWFRRIEAEAQRLRPASQF